MCDKKINAFIKELENQSCYFRLDYLYFLSMTGCFIENGFRYAFDLDKIRKSKSNRKHRKKLFQIIERLGEKNTNKYLKDGFKKNKTIDVYSEGFRSILEEIINNKTYASLKNRLELFFKYECAVFKEDDDLSKLKEIISVLAKKRNFLQHYIREKKDFKDSEVIAYIGIFIPDKLLYIFLGRMEHYACKKYKKKSKEYITAKKNVGKIRLLLKEIVDKKKKNIDYMYRSLRSKKKNKNKEFRRHLESKDLPWRKAFNIYYKTKDNRYREYNFKLVYFLIGHKNIEIIKETYKRENVSFIKEIEPIFYLFMNIGLVLHRNIYIIIEDIINYSIKKDGGCKTKSRKRREKYIEKIEKKCNEKIKNIRAIRNKIAHGKTIELLCDNINEKDKNMFCDIFLDIDNEEAIQNKKEISNNIITQMIRLFDKENYSYGSKNKDDTESKIKRWDLNVKYYNIDKRNKIKKIVKILCKKLLKYKKNDIKWHS